MSVFAMKAEERNWLCGLSDKHLCLRYCDRLPVVSGQPAQQAAYLRMRLRGESHNMAELLALRRFPSVRGLNADFMRGANSGDDDTKTDTLNAHYACLAKVNGTDINGKKYIPGLAAFPGDPQAWVSGTDDVRRVCADRGWNCSGLVEYQAAPAAPSLDVPIAKDIVEQHVAACLRGFEEGDHTPQLIADIRESVTAELSGAVDLSPELKVTDHNFEVPDIWRDECNGI